MNRIGLSSACFYPLPTEDSFGRLCSLGFKTAEIFMNSPSELEDDFIDALVKERDRYGVNVVSIHPFGSFVESYSLFSSYPRRFRDYLPLYLKFFRACEKLGAKVFVIHGAKIPGSIDDDEYCERFVKLIDEGEKFGVTVAHENVVHYRGESPDYLLMMRRKIGERFKTVIDNKQALRAGYSPYEFIEKLAPSIVHVHVSDNRDGRDCIPPGEGVFDFKKYFAAYDRIGYTGNFIIEMYSYSFERDDQLTDAKRYLEGIMKFSRQR